MNEQSLALGRLLGQTEAFTAVAGTCTAAQVARMRKIRDEKLYLGHAEDWGECCYKFFHTGKDNANRLIRLLDEFGPNYFLMTQYTPISAPVYRAIAQSIHDDTLHHDGEAIALIPENAEKVVAAVNQIRKTINIKPAAEPELEPEPPPPADPVRSVEAQCKETLAALESVIPLRTRSMHVRAIIHYVRERLNQLERTM